MLRVDDLHVSYQSVLAVRGRSVRGNRGQSGGLVGANVAGKPSTLKGITGLVRRRGRIKMGERDLSRLSTADIVRCGLVQVAQGRQLFPEMSVMENLELGAFLQNAASKREQAEKVFAQFPLLRERAYQRAGTLSGGEQQMLAGARALMARPKKLLVGEACLGVRPKKLC